MEVDLHLGARLRRRRRFLGLSQKELAHACGLRFQQIQKYECATNRMSAARVWQLAQVLGVEVDYFYDGLPIFPRCETARSVQFDVHLDGDAGRLEG